MAYTKTYFQDGDTLTATHMNTIEDGIISVENAVRRKQDMLVDGETIKTVNGESLLGYGNIEITGQGSGSFTVVDAALDNTSENPVQNKAIVEALSRKQDVLTVDNLHTIHGQSLLGKGDLTIVTVDDKLNIESTNPVQNKVVQTAIATKQDTLVSGTNIKTVNGQSLLGSGNITIQAQTPTEKGMVGKVISVLGDSISTFKGYIPVADGFNEEHPSAYPSGSVNTVEKTWWYKLINSYSAKLGINDSWSGSRVQNTYTDENPGGNVGTKVCMPSITRVTNLGSNGTPDVILFYGGTNDGKFSTFKELDLTQVYDEADLDAVTWTSFEEAYKTALMRLQHFYPKAKIVAITPTFVSSWYTNARLHEMDEHIKEICDYFGVICIDLRKCGITYQNRLTYLGDGLHPNAEGMALIANFIKGELEGKIVLDEGENVVYKVTNTLNSLTTSAPHVIGVSKGATYTATLSGATSFDGVQVFMGSSDVTSTALVNGVITISNVTGNIVVTDGEYTPPEDVEVTSISDATGSTSYSLNKGDTVQLSINYSPSNTTQKGVTWSSSTSSVASVSQSGLVTCVTSGNTTITATSTYNSSIKASWAIAVAEDVGGGDDGGGDENLPTEETWYVDFTSEGGNFNFSNAAGGVTFANETTYSKCVGVPINAVKLLVGSNGMMGYGKVASDGDTYTALGVITLSGASANASEAVAQTFKLNEIITLAEGERLVIMEYGSNSTGKIWVSTSSSNTLANVRTNIRSAGASKDETWKLPIGVGYVV